jgi:serine/threonine protein kinase/Tol biopolymer transport system component
MPLEPGSLLHNRYRIEGQLGKGGMGAVYLAHDQALRIKVAVKENLNLNPESERQFRREAELLAALRHPNLPRVTDHFILEERQYLVMDYIEGEDLHTRSHHQPPTLDEVLKWADGVCKALSYLHTRKIPIIHRDIKPANIKLQPDGSVILVDFGIAKEFDQAVTTTGARGLTPGFSPPEQYGAQRTDARSDQFSLGATIYSLLTGQRPADAIERSIKKADLIPASSLNPAVPAYIDEALAHALALDKDLRFPDIATFRAALQGKMTPATVMEATLPQTQPGTGGVRTVLETATPSAPPVVREALRGVQEPVIPDEQPRRRRGWIIAVAIVAVIIIGGGAAVALMGGFPSSQPEPSPTANLPLIVPDEMTDTPESMPDIPSATETPSPSPEPSFTPTPSLTLAPTPIPIGGGGRIAFVSDRVERVFQIWTMNPDGSDQRQLTVDPGDKFQPRWSPDGTRLLFVTDGGYDDFGNYLGMDIKVINADGTEIKWVVRSPGDDTDPTWSPDGSLIAFTSTRANKLRQVYVMNAGCIEQTEGCEDVTPRNVSCHPDFCAVEYSPTWLPAGFSPPSWVNSDQTLAVAVSINDAPAQIFIRSPEGGVPTDFDRNDQIVGVDHLRWSPDGASMVFTWNYQRGRNEIALVPLEDRGFSNTILTSTFGNKEPVFSPDGRYIAFTSSRDGDFEIYLMLAGGIDQENLTNSPSSKDMQPDWQPVAGP